MTSGTNKKRKNGVFRMVKSTEFKPGDSVVYPSHGVGVVQTIESQTIAGMEMKVYVIYFDKERMTLRTPVNASHSTGLRRVSSVVDIEKVRKTLQSRAKISRGMWSRRAKEYETKINSGNIVLLAEVVRDLHKNVNDPDRSYSERVIYENALSRLAGEVAAIQKVDQQKATESLIRILNKSAA